MEDEQESANRLSSGPSGPRLRSHYRPRTRRGAVAAALFIVLFLMAQPPLLLLANRVEPSLAGMPFLYVYLLAVYAAQIGVLLAIYRRGL